MPGRTLLDHFLKQMWEMNSFDALHALFDGILDLLAPPPPAAQDEDAPDRIHLSKTSPLGAFVRRAHLEFTRLQFDDSMKLWSSFIKYRSPTAQWTKRLAGLASSGVDAVMSEMGLRAGDDLYEAAYGHLNEQDEEGAGMSQDDLDRILDFQLDRLQKLGDRVPDEMKSQLRSMVKSSGLAHRQAHLVQFFDAWKAGDYTSAFDNLHRYYDYAMQTREKIHYQYALLHMAILQADFGCFGEAIAAINETIATARENQDMTCLSFSLSWLNHMARAYPKQMKGAGYISMLGSERDGLTFLKAKAKETKMFSLLSASLLNEAKLTLTTVHWPSPFLLKMETNAPPGRLGFTSHRIHLPVFPSQYQRECSQLRVPDALNSISLQPDRYPTSCQRPLRPASRLLLALFSHRGASSRYRPPSVCHEPARPLRRSHLHPRGRRPISPQVAQVPPIPCSLYWTYQAQTSDPEVGTILFVKA